MDGSGSHLSRGTDTGPLPDFGRTIVYEVDGIDKTGRFPYA